MDCEEARELYLADLAGDRPTPPQGVEQHLETCSACRHELQALAKTWTALGGLPLIAPDSRVARTLVRRLRREAVRESLRSLERWQQAALAGVAGFIASVLLSLFVPYDTMVRLCETVAPTGLPTPAAYAVAGLLYGLLPMALGTALERQGTTSRLVGSLEAVTIFMLVLVPYVLLRCSDFPLALLTGFLVGIALGALGGSLAGTKLRGQPAWT